MKMDCTFYVNNISLCGELTRPYLKSGMVDPLPKKVREKESGDQPVLVLECSCGHELNHTP